MTVSENIADLGGFECALEAAKLESDFDAKSFLNLERQFDVQNTKKVQQKGYLKQMFIHLQK
ncbi:hypothetical protein NW070_03080 [Mycoplasmopsis cynos]|nr:hypothetical protein [Mycoplasmopsis cynos]UWV77951.1 hypothetical protein NW070_03080 [Mycoplasmopsis cynos]